MTLDEKALERHQSESRRAAELHAELSIVIARRDREWQTVLKSLFPDREHLSSATFWDCPTSPIKHCVYDLDEDPCEDECLYCGDPRERK